MREILKPSIKRIAVFTILFALLAIPITIIKPILLSIFFLPITFLDLLHINLNTGNIFSIIFTLDRLELLLYGIIVIICYLLAGGLINPAKRKSALDGLIVFTALLCIILGTLFQIWQFNSGIVEQAKKLQDFYIFGIIGMVLYIISSVLIIYSFKRRTSKYIYVGLFIICLLVISSIFENLFSTRSINSYNKSKSGLYLQADPVFKQTDPPYVFTLSGEIRKDKNNKYSVKFNPFYFIPLNDKRLNINLFKSDFAIILRKNNKILKKESLEVKKCTVTPFEGCPKYDYSQGYFSHSIYKLQEMPDGILIFYKGNEIYSIKEPAERPALISINRQEFNGEKIIIMWEIPNNHQQFSYYSRIFINGENRNSISGKDMGDANGGFTESSLTFDPYNYNWDHGGNFQVEIVATDGFRTYKAISNVISVIDVPRFGKIETPQKGESWTQGQDIILKANSYNPDTRLHCDGCPEEGNTFLWESNIDGVLSTKSEVWCRYLSLGIHIITLTVTSSNGLKATDTTTVTLLPSNEYKNGTEEKEKTTTKEFCY